ncbi:large-conductance mechanosensitive channel protein MscL [Legionella waltersii]|uniref:Large-conductance mechanosensitive channel n=1 Tax=Legionella waltersii TaxID=66969 RepID=A0A0W1AAK3_9GAMM|nr:large-conductance mechanosensitive channel protein MscL [Legionella waltersii]KTD78331.1 large conductance mechanosensitive channel [Legionella waltersii]SNV08662.1 large conductance mechanosensitive channel, MscL family [Legionella waltersii]
MSFIQEFKEFAMRGNVMDLAIAVVIGAAFGKIVSAFVDGIVMPLIGLLLGGINIANKSMTIGDAVVKWGLFLQSIIDFTIIAFAIFVAIKLINLVKRKAEEATAEKITAESLLTEIRDIMKSSKGK